MSSWKAGARADGVGAALVRERASRRASSATGNTSRSGALAAATRRVPAHYERLLALAIKAPAAARPCDERAPRSAQRRHLGPRRRKLVARAMRRCRCSTARCGRRRVLEACASTTAACSCSSGTSIAFRVGQGAGVRAGSGARGDRSAIFETLAKNGTRDGGARPPDADARREGHQRLNPQLSRPVRA